MENHASRRTAAGRRSVAGVLAIVLAASLLAPTPVRASPSQASPTGPVWIQTSSAADDPVGLGGERSYLPATHDFAASGTERTVRMAAGGPSLISVTLAVPSDGPALAVGRYGAVAPWDRGPGQGTIAVSMDGRTCASATGSFEIDEITFVDGELSTLVARFEQVCRNRPDSPLTGELRWDASAELPSNFPAPAPPAEGFFRAPAGTFDPTQNQLLFSSWYPVTDTNEQSFERIGVVESATRRSFGPTGGGRLETGALFEEQGLRLHVDVTFQWSDRQDVPQPGLYTRLPDLGDDSEAGGFGMWLPGFSCPVGIEQRRDVVIDELDLAEDPERVEDLSMRFERTCGPGERRMDGELRWQAYTPPGTPGMPTAVTSEAGADSAQVAWTAPADTGASTLTGYQIITYRDGLALDEKTVVGPGATAATIGGLEPGHLHLFKVAAINAEGVGRRSLASDAAMVPGPDLGPFGSASAFVRQQYVDFTGRAPTAAEARAQTTALRLGTTSPQEVIRTLQTTPSWQDRRAAVTRLYAAYLQRTPDTGGLEYWTARLRGGVSLFQVSASFAGSSEFIRRYGRLADGAFVDLVYRNVLGRAPDPSGRAHWIQSLAAGAKRGTVMVHFSESSEHRRKMAPTVDAVLTHVGMLRRVPTAHELQAALGGAQVASNSAAPADMVRSLLASGEYARRVS